MNERTIFMAALEKETSEQRSAFLDEACAGDGALRQRVEALLHSHEQAGSFLGKPAPECLAVGLASPNEGAETQDNTPDHDAGGEALDFLTPTDKPGMLGRLEHYDILEVVGRGGMGIVLRAFDEELHRVVAIKVMAPQLAASAIARKRFKREAQAAAAVSHDHVVTIHGVDEANGLPYLVMQCVSGLSLQERLDQTGPLQLAELVRIGMQTAFGLAAAHSQGLIHRDIKPANILLENGIERVKITDFGLARVVDDASLTQSGTVAGTPQYMSPEQAEGGQVDQRTDLFSLGSVLYAMCTGRPPFRATGTMAVLKRVCEETPRPIPESNPDIPDWLVAIIDKLHAKNPADRYQSAAEVAELLNQHLAHLQHPSVMPLPVTRPAKPPTAGKHRFVAALALLSLITGVIVLLVALTRLHSPEDNSVAKDGSEGKTPPAEKASKPDPHPFVVLASKKNAERKFDTLAEAVWNCLDSDIIEIRGNGPFAIKPMEIKKALTIRAGAGFQPVITDNLDTVASDNSLLYAQGSLNLEGLEFHCSSRLYRILHSQGPLSIANCRFFNPYQSTVCIEVENSARIQNCDLLSPIAAALAFHCDSNGSSTVTNCLLTGHINLQEHDVDRGAKLRFTRNTFLSPLKRNLSSNIVVARGKVFSGPNQAR